MAKLFELHERIDTFTHKCIKYRQESPIFAEFAVRLIVHKSKFF